MFKEFWRDFIFALRLVVHIHALRKNIFEGSKVMDPRLLAIFIFFQERDILFFLKGYLLLFSKFFYLFRKLRQGWDKNAWTQRGILTKYLQCTSKGDLCLHCSLYICFFSFDVHLEPWFTFGMNLASGLPNLFEVFPAGVSPQYIYTSNAYESINSDGSLIKFDMKPHLIKDPKH